MKITGKIEIPAEILLSLKKSEDEFITELKRTAELDIIEKRGYRWVNVLYLLK